MDRCYVQEVLVGSGTSNYGLFRRTHHTLKWKRDYTPNYKR